MRNSARIFAIIWPRPGASARGQLPRSTALPVGQQQPAVLAVVTHPPGQGLQPVGRGAQDHQIGDARDRPGSGGGEDQVVLVETVALAARNRVVPDIDQIRRQQAASAGRRPGLITMAACRGPLAVPRLRRRGSRPVLGKRGRKFPGGRRPGPARWPRLTKTGSSSASTWLMVGSISCGCRWRKRWQSGSTASLCTPSASRVEFLVASVQDHHVLLVAGGRGQHHRHLQVVGRLALAQRENHLVVLEVHRLQVQDRRPGPGQPLLAGNASGPGRRSRRRPPGNRSRPPW